MLHEFNALGTKWWIDLPKSKNKLNIGTVKQTVEDFENNYSRFKEDSYIGQLNNKKFLDSPPSELVNMLTYAINVYIASGGVFNISVGSALEKSGYGEKYDDNSKISTDLPSDIIVSSERITLNPSTRIDLGGFGKGWLIQKLYETLKHNGAKYFSINGGGDIVNYGKANDFFIEHPKDHNLYIGKILLNNQSLASSSNIKRSWRHKGKKHAHIIHPASSKPSSSALSMHILADNILFADTFATIFMLIDRPKRHQLAKEYGLEFLEIMPDMTTYKTPGFNVELNT